MPKNLNDALSKAILQEHAILSAMLKDYLTDGEIESLIDYVPISDQEVCNNPFTQTLLKHGPSEINDNAENLIIPPEQDAIRVGATILSKIANDPSLSIELRTKAYDKFLKMLGHPRLDSEHFECVPITCLSQMSDSAFASIISHHQNYSKNPQLKALGQGKHLQAMLEEYNKRISDRDLFDETHEIVSGLIINLLDLGTSFSVEKLAYAIVKTIDNLVEIEPSLTWALAERRVNGLPRKIASSITTDQLQSLREAGILPEEIIAKSLIGRSIVWDGEKNGYVITNEKIRENLEFLADRSINNKKFIVTDVIVAETTLLSKFADGELNLKAGSKEISEHLHELLKVAGTRTNSSRSPTPAQMGLELALSPELIDMLIYQLDRFGGIDFDVLWPSLHTGPIKDITDVKRIIKYGDSNRRENPFLINSSPGEVNYRMDYVLSDSHTDFYINVAPVILPMLIDATEPSRTESEEAASVNFRLNALGNVLTMTEIKSTTAFDEKLAETWVGINYRSYQRVAKAVTQDINEAINLTVEAMQEGKPEPIDSTNSKLLAELVDKAALKIPTCISKTGNYAGGC